MITIRNARPDEIELLRVMSVETCEDTFGPFNTPENMKAFMEEAYNPKQLEKEMYEPGSALFFACEGDTVIGFMRLRKTDEAEKHLGTKTLELQRLYILPRHKGKKAGSALMKLAVETAMSQGCEWLWLGVWERNFPAQKFYASWGFERFSEHVFVMGDDAQTDWLLKKRLKGESS